MNIPKKLKYYANARDQMEVDYWNKLEEEDEIFLRRALGEMYCGWTYNKEYGCENSLHAKAGIENYKSLTNKESKSRRKDVFAGGSIRNDLDITILEKEIYEEYNKNEEEMTMTDLLNIKTVELLDELNQVEDKTERFEIVNQYLRDCLTWFAKQLKEERKLKTKQNNEKLKESRKNK